MPVPPKVFGVRPEDPRLCLFGAAVTHDGGVVEEEEEEVAVVGDV